MQVFPKIGPQLRKLTPSRKPKAGVDNAEAWTAPLWPIHRRQWVLHVPLWVQLTIFIAAVSVISLLILAVVTITKTSSYARSMLLSKLAMYAATESSLLEQSLESLNTDISWMLNRPVVQNTLKTIEENTVNTTLSSQLSSYMQSVITVKPSYYAIVVYNTTYDQVYSREQGTSQLPLTALLPAITDLLPVQAPSTLNISRLLSVGIVQSPAPIVSQGSISAYIMSITLPIYDTHNTAVIDTDYNQSNYSVIGYGTVVFNAASLGSSSFAYLNNGILDIAAPVAITSSTTGFQPIILDDSIKNLSTLDTVYAFSDFPAMESAYNLPQVSQYSQRPSGALFHTKTIYEQDASVGYSVIDFMDERWLICVEMRRKAIEGDIVSLRNKLIGVCIGLLGLILLFIIPAGRIMTNPLYKIYNGMEFESSQDEKETHAPKLSARPSFQRILRVQDTDRKVSNPTLKRENTNVAGSNATGNTSITTREYSNLDHTSLLRTPPPPQVKFTSSALNDIVAGASSGAVNVTREGTSTLHVTAHPSALRINSFKNEDPPSGLSPPAGMERSPSSFIERGERHWYSHIRSLVVNRSQPALGPQFDHLVIDWSQGLHVPAKIQNLGRLYRDELDDLVEAYNSMIDKLNNQYTFLEDQVKVRTQEADIARDVAEKANAAKSQFIANITHELRTPLNGIMGMTSVTLSETNHAKIRMSLQVIIESAGVLMELLNELLAFSKLQIDMTPKMGETTALQFLESLNHLYLARATAKNVAVAYAFEPVEIRNLTISCDSYRITQITSHILSNAIKFSQENSSVNVTVRFKATVDQDISLAPYKDLVKTKPQGATRFAMLEFVVSDAGRGLSEKQLSSVFEPFVQGDDAFNKQHQGSGLGMSMCKQLAEVIGGYVSVWSAENHGTCVIFRCPVKVENYTGNLSALDSPPLQWAHSELYFTSSLNAGHVSCVRTNYNGTHDSLNLGAGSSGGPQNAITEVTPNQHGSFATTGDLFAGGVIAKHKNSLNINDNKSVTSGNSGAGGKISPVASHRNSIISNSVLNSSDRNDIRDSAGSTNNEFSRANSVASSAHRRSIFQSFADRLLQARGSISSNRSFSHSSSDHHDGLRADLSGSVGGGSKRGSHFSHQSRKSKLSTQLTLNKELPPVPPKSPATSHHFQAYPGCEAISPTSSPTQSVSTPDNNNNLGNANTGLLIQNYSSSPGQVRLPSADPVPPGSQPLQIPRPSAPSTLIVSPITSLAHQEILTPQGSEMSNQESRQRFLSQLHPDLKVLVADDNTLNLEIMVKMLRSIGISDIDTAGDGETVVQLVEKSIKEGYHYTVIFMDLVMPKCNGLDAAQIIRTTLGYPYPIIALTGFSDQQTEDQCASANIQEVLIKPVLRTALADVIIKYELFTLDIPVKQQ